MDERTDIDKDGRGKQAKSSCLLNSDADDRFETYSTSTHGHAWLHLQEIQMQASSTCPSVLTVITRRTRAAHFTDNPSTGPPPASEICDSHAETSTIPGYRCRCACPTKPSWMQHRFCQCQRRGSGHVGAAGSKFDRELRFMIQARQANASKLGFRMRADSKTLECTL